MPVEGAEGKVLYVWFDAPIGYISATKDLTPDWEKYWKSEDTKMVHFIGKDNIVFHCIVFPSMLKAHGGYILPENVPANEFLNLEGDKISTSRNWAVWLHEYLEEFPERRTYCAMCCVPMPPKPRITTLYGRISRPATTTSWSLCWEISSTVRWCLRRNITAEKFLPAER